MVKSDMKAYVLELLVEECLTEAEHGDIAVNCHQFSPGIILAHMDKPLETEEISKVVQTLNGKTTSESDALEANCMLKTDILKVESVEGCILEKDHLKLFFSSQKRCGGGPVTEVFMMEHHSSALLCYASYKDAWNVYEKYHQQNKNPLKFGEGSVTVDLYYDCLRSDPTSWGTSDFRETREADKKTEVTAPTEHLKPFTYKFDNHPEVVSFIKQKKEHLEKCSDALQGFADLDFSRETLDVMPLEGTKEKDDVKNAFESQDAFRSKCTKLLDDFFSHYSSETVTFDIKKLLSARKIYKELCKEYTPDEDSDDLSLSWDSDFDLRLTGLKDVVNMKKKKLKKLVNKTRTDSKDISPEKMRLLKECGQYEDLQKQMEAYGLHWEISNGKIHMTFAESNRYGRIHLENFLSNVKEKTIRGLSEEQTNFLKFALHDEQNEEIKASILQSFQDKNIKATLALADDDAFIFQSFSELSADKAREACNLLKTIISTKCVPIDPAKKKAMASKKWQNFVNRLSESSCVKIHSTAAQIFVVGLTSSIHNVLPQISDFFDKNVDHEKVINTSYGKAEFAVNRSKTFSEFSRTQRGIECSISSRDGGGILLKGKASALDQAEKDMNSLLPNVIEMREVITKAGAYQHFHGADGKKRLNDLQALHSCAILLDSPDCPEWKKERDLYLSSSVDKKKSTSRSANAPAPAAKVPLTSVKLQMKSDVEISVWKDDLTEHKCDAIVNTVNEAVRMKGTLAKLIITKGGDAIEKELKRNARNFHTGDACMTGNGKLKSCNKIIHIAVPDWTEGAWEEVSVKQLQSCVSESLKQADKRNMKTLAFPAICCGVVGQEPHKIIPLMLAAVIDYFDSKKRGLTEIHFVENENQNIVDELIEEIERLKRDLSDDTPSTYPVQLTSNAQVMLVAGDISAQTVDVIVNTTPSDHVKKMSGGAVTKALAKKCGQGVVNECGKLKGPFCPGDVLETSGGNLRCSKLFHAVTTNYDAAKSEEMVRAIVMKSLKKADMRGLRSIAFPSIGTGGFKHPPNLVAGWMESEISNYNGSKVKEIRIILYPADTHVISAFETKFGMKAQPAIQIPPSQVGIPAGGASASTQPSKPSIDIGPLTISVYQGDITKEKTNMIVNSTNENFDLSQGKVSSTICENGGPAIQAECKASNGKEYRVTSGGNLACDSIIHVVAPRNINLLKDLLLTVLQVADNKGVKTLSIPAIGTGNLSMTSSFIAKLMHECFQIFAKQNSVTKNLNQVNIVIWETNMLQEFQKTILSSSKGVFGHISDTFSSIKGYLWDTSKSSATPAEYNHPAPAVFNTDQLLVFMYSDNKTNLDSAFKSMEDEIEKNCTSYKVALENLDMTDEDINFLEQTHRVKIVHHKTRWVNELILEGIKDNMVPAVEGIRKYIERITVADKKAKYVTWKYLHGDQSWKNFDDEDNVKLEREYQKQKPPAIRSHSTVEMKLTPYGYESLYKVDMAKKLMNSSIEISREQVFDSVEDVPSNWVKSEHGKEGVEVPQNSAEYQDIVKKLASSKHYQNIVSVKRIQNEQLYRQFMSKKAEVKRKLKKHKSTNPLIRELYHGTKCAAEILENGFDRSHAGKNATLYGRGVYFAVSADYSHRYTSSEKDAKRTLFIADVITGDYCKGDSSMATPPARDAGNKLELYDSLVDDENSPNMFVVFKDASVYPKYLVTYTYNKN